MGERRDKVDGDEDEGEDVDVDWVRSGQVR